MTLERVARLPDIWHGVRLAVAPERRPPFEIDALVVEDDTWRVPPRKGPVRNPSRLCRSGFG